MKKYIIGTGITVVVAAMLIYVISNMTTPITVSTLPQKTYIALGDSVAAGIGLEDNSDSSACDRTNQSYPNVIASQLGYNLKNFACNHATILAGITGEQNVNNLMIASQLQQLFDLPKPNLATITIGAN